MSRGRDLFSHKVGVQETCKCKLTAVEKKNKPSFLPERFVLCDISRESRSCFCIISILSVNVAVCPEFSFKYSFKWALRPVLCAELLFTMSASTLELRTGSP